MDIKDKENIFQDWLTNKRLHDKSRKDIKKTFTGFFIAFLPTLCLIFCLCVPAIRKTKVYMLIIGIYLVHLLPYVFISHYFRYQFFLMALQTILMFIVVGFIAHSIEKVFNHEKNVKPQKISIVVKET